MPANEEQNQPYLLYKKVKIIENCNNPWIFHNQDIALNPRS